MDADALLALLKDNSVFWSKLGFCYDPPRFGADGKPIVFFEDFAGMAKYHRDFYEAGIKLHTSILFTGWVGVDKYDYELTDRVLDTIFSCGGELLYIPRVKLNAPLEWARANPEELCVYFNGPRDAEEVRALVGTGKHDLLGYQSPRGYYTAGGWQDDRPNVGGLISNQSFSSEKWLADAGEALRRLVRHVEDGPYGDRVCAYHVAYGASGESCLWGRCDVHDAGDYGVANRRAFFDWGMRKHGSLAKLRETWNNPSLTRANAEPPPPSRREGDIADMRDLMRGTPEDRICVDYDLFMADANMDALERFGSIVKAETRGKPVGAFYGYFLGVARSAYTGYLGIERFLDSPCLDFIAAPKMEGGGEMGPAQSINRRKLWMDELDNRTHIAKGVGLEHKSSSLEETICTMWREFAKNLAHRSGFWWMDLGGGWYDDPELLREIGRIEGTAKKLRRQRAESLSDVLLVADEDAFFHSKVHYALHKRLFVDTIQEAQRCGALLDTYRFRDLETLDLARYKLVVFLNPFLVDLERWKRIAPRLPAGVTLLWNYAPGVLSPDYAPKNVGAFCGFEVRERPAAVSPEVVAAGYLAGTPPLAWDASPPDEVPIVHHCPLFEIVGPCEPLARYADGGVAIGARAGQVYAAAPLLKAAHLRRIMERAGCRLYAPLGYVVYGDSRFFSVSAAADGELELRLPPGGFNEVVRGDGSLSAETISLRMRENETRFFQKTASGGDGRP